ncbi:hypothetical protein B0H14DRAFT_2613002 [Mycena olivaceomarginata]|nr:hypothetical protein B0H14DRAFT_2613002 [Mycena olivaceomarginata]
MGQDLAHTVNRVPLQMGYILSDQARQRDDCRRMPMPQVGLQTPSSINAAMQHGKNEENWVISTMQGVPPPTCRCHEFPNFLSLRLIFQRLSADLAKVSVLMNRLYAGMARGAPVTLNLKAYPWWVASPIPNRKTSCPSPAVRPPDVCRDVAWTAHEDGGVLSLLDDVGRGGGESKAGSPHRKDHPVARPQHARDVEVSSRIRARECALIKPCTQPNQIICHVRRVAHRAS